MGLVALDTRRSTRDAPRRRARRRGFSLVELIIVLAITTIALTVGAIRLGRLSVTSSEGERVARRFVADLRLAHSQAVAEANDHFLWLNTGESKYISYAMFRDGSPAVQVAPTWVLPDCVALTGPAPKPTFHPGGDADASYTYTVTTPGRSWQIDVVLATGLVTLVETTP